MSIITIIITTVFPPFLVCFPYPLSSLILSNLSISTSQRYISVECVTHYVTSGPKRVQVRWSTVGWGLSLQFGVSLLVLRTQVGKAALVWVADRLTEYLAYTDHGARFVFGKNFDDHHFAFKVSARSFVLFFPSFSLSYPPPPRCGELRRQELKTQSSKVSPFQKGSDLE